MDRRGFLRLFGYGAAAVATGTVLLHSVRKPYVPPRVTAGCDPATGKITTWFLKKRRGGRSFVLYTGKKGMEDFHKALYEYYREMNLIQFTNHLSSIRNNHIL